MFISGEKCLFSDGASRFLRALLQRSLARRSRAPPPPPPCSRFPLKRRCLLFVKEAGGAQPLPATAAFLKCDLSLSFCRVAPSPNILPHFRRRQFLICTLENTQTERGGMHFVRNKHQVRRGADADAFKDAISGK